MENNRAGISDVQSLKASHRKPDIRFAFFRLVGAASSGFLVRGGVTIGDLIHDTETVFGLGLNRAYELESEVAKMPRIVLDDRIVREFEQLPIYVQKDENLHFLDPFTPNFLQLAAKMEMPIAPESLESIGVPGGDHALYSSVPPHELLIACLDGLKPYLRVPLADNDWERFVWLYD